MADIFPFFNTIPSFSVSLSFSMTDKQKHIITIIDGIIKEKIKN